jgi:hypothetical protein
MAQSRTSSAIERPTPAPKPAPGRGRWSVTAFPPQTMAPEFSRHQRHRRRPHTRVEQSVLAGTQRTAVVPTDESYIVANDKETQLHVPAASPCG